jgi:hypothetical protein
MTKTEISTKWRKEHPERHCLNVLRSYHKQYTQVILAYGGKCVCCGETELDFLQLDHINGYGGKHRARVGGGTGGLLRDLIKQNFPPIMQVLCANCHIAKTRKIVCPHQRGKS